MNVVGNVDTTATNHPTQGKNWKLFDVPTDVFRRFETGRNKFERWSKYLDINDEYQKTIVDYAKTKPKHTIVLRDSNNGAMRQIRRRSANHI